MVSNQLVYGSMHYQEYIQEGLEKFPDVDGIFASSDLIAAQVIQICNQMGIHIPEKIKLVGFDDVLIASVTTPTITTIHQPIKEMSELSVDYIDRLQKNEVVPSRTSMPVWLVKRDSTL